MKRLFGIMLCLLLVCASLFSCKKTVIGEDLKYREDDTGDDSTIETLNMYIIVGENTDVQVLKTVSSQINVYLKEEYQSQLNIVYCTADEYYDKLNASIADGVEEADRADIVLINSASLFDELYDANKLACLTSFYHNKKYETLNAIIEDNLLASSVVKETVLENEEEKLVDNYYTVPNNHLIGEYSYIVVDKIQASYVKNFSSSKISAMNNAEDLAIYVSALGGNEYVSLRNGGYEDKLLLEYGCNSLDELKAKIGVYFDENVATDDLVGEALEKAREEYVTENSYIVEDDGEYKVKAPIKKVNYVNVASYPNSTKGEAFSSAFAVIKNLNDTTEIRQNAKENEELIAIIDKHYSKCMDIILALNTDVKLRNMLQYGYVGTNYKFVLDKKNNPTDYVVREQEGSEKFYNMNLAYTGNPYIAYYCESIGWNSEIHNNILKQNVNSYTLEEKVEAELSRLADLYGEGLNINFKENVVLPSNGVIYGDVKIVWSSPSEFVENKGRTDDVFNDHIFYANYTDSPDSLNTQLIATLTCTDAFGDTVEQTFTIDTVVEYTSEQKLERELETFDFETKWTFNEAITLNKTGRLHTDVEIVWELMESEFITIDSKNNYKVTFTAPESNDDFIVALKGIFTCGDKVAEKEYSVKVYTLEEEVNMVLNELISKIESDTLTFEDVLTLTTSVSDHLNVKINWTTAGSTLVKLEGGKLTVNASEDDTPYTFDLTVAVSKSVGKGVNKEDQAVSHTFTFTVNPPEEVQE